MPLPLRTKKTLTLDIAKALAEVAEACIARRGFAMFVAIVDDAGTPLYVARFNDAQPASYEVAVQKAQAAARFRRATRAFEDRLLKDGRLNLLSMPGFVGVEGGVPFLLSEAVLGAIGVSGGSGVEDGQVAAAVVEALPGILGPAQ